MIDEQYNWHFINLSSFQNSLKFLEYCIYKRVKLVLVHGDLHRFNIFFCNNAYKLIDFEAAHYDDPYVDLAHLAVFLVLILNKKNIF